MKVKYSNAGEVEKEVPVKEERKEEESSGSWWSAITGSGPSSEDKKEEKVASKEEKSQTELTLVPGTVPRVLAKDTKFFNGKPLPNGETQDPLPNFLKNWLEDDIAFEWIVSDIDSFDYELLLDVIESGKEVLCSLINV